MKNKDDESIIKCSRKGRKLPIYMGYIYDLIYESENMILFNKNRRLFNFIDKCRKNYDNAQVLLIFDKNTLSNYDAALRSFANIIFERVPDDFEIELNKTPSMKQFKSWIISLKETELFTVLYFLKKYGYINIGDELHFEFIINVFYTLRVL